ncbi:MAG: tRNA threonylcarbamoyladenosine dehydratase [Oscillospiraceae bacterium]|nr:tRNA threonylcarbamoyladenosine dehydratase [Oscillospiraceae bacterium]
MPDRFSRTEMIFGPEAMKKLYAARVAVFGIGGVGSYAVEALARSGIGAMDLYDHDRVCLSNLNRQLIATQKTLGMFKVDAAKDRVSDINPECQVRANCFFFLPETAKNVDFHDFDYVVDAVDTVTAKLALIEAANVAGIPIISAMGTGNKRYPGMLKVADIFDTSVCPLARIMRKECRKRGIKKCKVVYSEEEPITPAESDESDNSNRRAIPGSTAFVPAAAGLLIAGEVVNDIIQR